MQKIKPIIIKANKFNLKSFAKKYKVTKVIDNYKIQLEDLFLIRNPRYRFNKNYPKDFELFIKKFTKVKDLSQIGNWVYFPWNGYLVHYLPEKLHQEVRTARNRDLITLKEQTKIYNSKIGIAGLSVGSNIFLALLLMGVGKYFKIADPDFIAPSNLNRMIFDFTWVGVNKAEALAYFAYQLNPYLKIEIYDEGINEKNYKNFIKGLDIIVEELDDIEVKYKVREEAKKLKIPVVMATDNGDNVILDIERFDTDKNLEIFDGRLKGFDITEVKKSPQKLYEAMAKIIDLNLVPLRSLKSVLEVGKTLYSWPQLSTAAFISGGITAYCVRSILLGKKIKTGKYDFNIEKILDQDHEKNELIRKKFLNKIRKLFNF
ncbi:MAG: hypothetical protein KatS3mg095_0856 [Candidatus Parcubacteria bacterium]|nr:MAG: hypothetical protein KatS3mg095_0856 [Candidatus Parcubacteria bacterium]